MRKTAAGRGANNNKQTIGKMMNYQSLTAATTVKKR